MSRPTLFAALGTFVSLIGLAISIWLLRGGETQAAASDCLVRLPGDCASVLRSGYTRLLSISLPAWGILYFTSVAAAFAVEIRASSPRRLKILLWMIAGGVASGGWLLLLMWRLEQWCGTCVLVHSLNLLLLMLATTMALHASLPKLRLGLECLAVATMTLSVWGTFHRPQASYTGVPVPLAAPNAKSEQLQVAKSAATRSIGNDSYPLVVGRDGDVGIRLFVDPTCRECSRLWQMLSSIRAENAGRLRIEIYFFPLEKACNPYVPHQSVEHIGACRLVQVAHFVGMQSHEEVFADFYTAIGQTAGEERWIAAKRWAARQLERPVLAEDFDVDEVRERMQADRDLALDYGVESLPTIVLGGQRYAGCPRDRAELVSMLQPFLNQHPHESIER
jgi:uncharacterized membrane protein/predicted DsbA family dithiol-disulfide isomerase